MLTAGERTELNNVLTQVQNVNEVLLPYQSEAVIRKLELLCPDVGMYFESAANVLLAAENKIIKVLNQA